MRLTEEITFDQVIDHWLAAEAYKLDDPSPASLEAMRPACIRPLSRLPVTWHYGEIETEADFNALHVVRYLDWEDCTGGTFSITGIPANVHLNPGHHRDILKKQVELQQAGGFRARAILFGNSLARLTIIEGNHRLGAYKLEGDEAGYDFLPLGVIVGLSPESHRVTSCQDYQPPYDEQLYVDVPAQRQGSPELASS